jgi:hypothetical protein
VTPPSTPPDLRSLSTDEALADAIIYYAERASRVIMAGSNRKQLRALLCEYDLRVAAMLKWWRG